MAMHKDAIFFLVKSQTKIKKFGLGAGGQKVKIWPKILDFPACESRNFDVTL